MITLMMIVASLYAYSQVEYTPVNESLDSIIAYTYKIGYKNVARNDTTSNGIRYDAWDKDYNSFVNIVTVPTKKRTLLAIVYTFNAKIPDVKKVQIDGFKAGLYKKRYIITDGNYKAIRKAADKLDRTDDGCTYSYYYKGNTCKVYSYKRGNTYYTTVKLNGRVVSTATVNVRY